MEIDWDKIDDAVLALLWLTLHVVRRPAELIGNPALLSSHTILCGRLDGTQGIFGLDQSAALHAGRSADGLHDAVKGLVVLRGSPGVDGLGDRGTGLALAVGKLVTAIAAQAMHGSVDGFEWGVSLVMSFPD